MEFIGNIVDDIMLDNSDEIIIFGTGNIGKQISSYLALKYGKTKKIYFCDNDFRKVGTCIDEHKVLSVKKALEIFPTATFLIGSCFVRQMVEQLLKENVKKIHIVRV